MLWPVATEPEPDLWRSQRWSASSTSYPHRLCLIECAHGPCKTVVKPVYVVVVLSRNGPTSNVKMVVFKKQSPSL